MARIGIDLGGTKIAAVALDRDGRVLAARRVATPRDDYAATIAAVVTLVAALEGEAGERATVGVGMPGAVASATGLVKNANSVWLNGRAFPQDLAAALRREVRCANDANCLALSEATDGAGAGANTVFAAILGTGVGGGITVNGSLLSGRNGVAGEWGHNPLPWQQPDESPGPECYCGKHGCVETWLSGPGLQRDHHASTGAELDAEEIARAAAGGDPQAEASLRRYERRLARALAHVVNVLDPDVIVLGGGVSGIRRLYHSVPRLLPLWVFGGEADTPVRPAAHGPASGVRGAAWLWPRE